MKLARGDYVGDITPHANFGNSTPKGEVLHMREIVIVRVYFLHPRYFLANVNSSSCSQYVVVRPSVVCLSVCIVRAPYSDD